MYPVYFLIGAFKCTIVLLANGTEGYSSLRSYFFQFVFLDLLHVFVLEFALTNHLFCSNGVSVYMAESQSRRFCYSSSPSFFRDLNQSICRLILFSKLSTSQNMVFRCASRDITVAN